MFSIHGPIVFCSFDLQNQTCQVLEQRLSLGLSRVVSLSLRTSKSKWDNKNMEDLEKKGVCGRLCAVIGISYVTYVEL